MDRDTVTAVQVLQQSSQPFLGALSLVLDRLHDKAARRGLVLASKPRVRVLHSPDAGWFLVATACSEPRVPTWLHN